MSNPSKTSFSPSNADDKIETKVQVELSNNIKDLDSADAKRMSSTVSSFRDMDSGDDNDEDDEVSSFIDLKPKAVGTDSGNDDDDEDDDEVSSFDDVKPNTVGMDSGDKNMENRNSKQMAPSSLKDVKKVKSHGGTRKTHAAASSIGSNSSAANRSPAPSQSRKDHVKMAKSNGGARRRTPAAALFTGSRNSSAEKSSTSAKLPVEESNPDDFSADDNSNNPNRATASARVRVKQEIGRSIYQRRIRKENEKQHMATIRQSQNKDNDNPSDGTNVIEVHSQEESDTLKLDDDEVVKPGAFAVAGMNCDSVDESNADLPVFDDDFDNNFSVRKIALDGGQTQDIVGVEEEGLIQAELVNDEGIIQAEAVSEQALKRKYYILVCVSVGIIAFIIIMSTVFLRDNSSHATLSPTISASSIPSSIPSTAPSTSPTSSTQSFLEMLSPQLIPKFEIEDSPQSEALAWLENNHTDVTSLPDYRIAQRFALAVLFYSSAWSKWIYTDKWLSSEHECDWFTMAEGGGCSSGRIVELVLTSNRIRGPVPPEIHLLSNLQVLDLSGNIVVGTLPSEIGLMTNLKTINLRENSIGGTLPSELALLSTSLFELMLSSNNLQGSLPTGIGRLTSLVHLEINDNVLVGSIPRQLGNLSMLTSLALTDNNLSGFIPMTVFLMEELKILVLDRNQLSGILPATNSLNISNSFSKLEYFGCRSNHLSGTFPRDLPLSKLVYADISSNLIFGTLATEIGKAVDLKWVDFSNNFFYGKLPSEVANLVRLETLDMSDNGLSGTLPAEIRRLTHLKTLSIGKNNLSGALPTKLGALTEMQSLDLSYNRFTGQLPSSLEAMRVLDVLKLRKNYFVDTIPSFLQVLSNLEIIDFRHNEFYGSLPTTLGGISSLESLILDFNQLSGVLPTELSLLANLKVLSLYGLYAISGTIPTSLGLLKKLATLNIKATSLSGSVPTEICELRNTFGTLTELGVNCERISGPCIADVCIDSADFTESTILDCPDGSTLLQVGIATDRIPQDAAWVVTDKNANQTYLSGGPYITRVDRYRTIFNQTCVPSNACLAFRVLSANNIGARISGALAGDQFTLLLNHEKIGSGSMYARKKKPLLFGDNCTYESGQPIAQNSSLNIIDEKGNGCFLCEDGSAPPYGDTIVPPLRYKFMFSSTDNELTCSEYNAFLVAFGDIHNIEPARCRAEQATAGVLCGCQNSIAKKESCNICGVGGDITSDVSLGADIFGFYATCNDINFYGETQDACDSFGRLSTFCCPRACSALEPCDRGYFCDDTSGICQFCDNPDASKSGCLTFDWSQEAPNKCPFTYCPKECDDSDNMASLGVILSLDIFPGETSWDLVDEGSGELLAEGKNYEDSWVPRVSEVCIPRDACVVFTIYDRNGICCYNGRGSYTLTLDGEKIASGGEFASSEFVRIGDCTRQ